MTRQPHTIGLALVAIMLSIPAATASTQAAKKTDQPTVEGRWTGRITGTPHGDMAMSLSLKQDGKKVTGTLTTEHTGDLAVEGELTDRTLKLSTGSNAETEITLTGTLKDDGSLGGSLSSQVGDMTWSAERVTDKQ